MMTITVLLIQAPQLIFPLLWYDEGADITDEYKSYFFRCELQLHQ